MQAHLPLPRSRTHPGSPSPGEQNGRSSPSLAPDASRRSVSLLTAAHTATDPLGNSLGDRTSLAQGHEANKGQGEEPELGSVFQTLPLPDLTPNSRPLLRLWKEPGLPSPISPPGLEREHCFLQEAL